MAKHVKPTKEELDANIKKAQEDLDKLDNPQPTPSSPVPSPSQAVPSPSQQVPTASPSEEIPPEPTPSEPVPSKEIIKDVLKVTKKKFSESSREAQIIAQNKKQLEEQIDEAQNMPEPTEEELKYEFPEWETLTDFEKRLAKDNLYQKRINERIKEIRNQQKEAEKRINERIVEVEEFLIDAEILKKFPDLEKKEEEFKKFATKSTRLTLDLEDLAKLFLFDMPQPIRHKGAMFETGSGGPNERPQPKSDKISIDNARILMKTDYKKYKEYLKAGKIEVPVI